MFYVGLIAFLFAAVRAEPQKYWDQNSPGYYACYHSLFYGRTEGPVVPTGYGKIGDRDNKFVLTFDPPVECQPWELSRQIDYYCLYSLNTTYTLTLKRKDDVTFGGFAIYGRGYNVSTFLNPSAGGQIRTQQWCPTQDNAKSAFGHTNGNIARHSVSVDWKSPTTNQEDHEFWIVVKDSTDLTGGEYFSWSYRMLATRQKCREGHFTCTAPAVVNESAFCSNFNHCRDGRDFGNETAKCCMPPPPETPAPAPASSSSVPSPAGQDTTDGDLNTDESSAPRFAIHATLAVVLSIICFQLA